MDNKKKLIFLDVDGVLNSDSYWQKTISKDLEWSDRRIDPKLVRNLSRIVQQTGAEIVVSSTWRRFKEDMDSLKRYLSAKDLHILDTTPILPGYRFADGRKKQRGDEITKWFEDHPDYKDADYIILDDDDDMTIHMDHLIQTSYIYGLSNSKTLKAIKALNHEI